MIRKRLLLLPLLLTFVGFNAFAGPRGGKPSQVSRERVRGPARGGWHDHEAGRHLSYDFGRVASQSQSQDTYRRGGPWYRAQKRSDRWTKATWAFGTLTFASGIGTLASMASGRGLLSTLAAGAATIGALASTWFASRMEQAAAFDVAAATRE